MNEYLKNENSLAPYMVFPRFLLDAGINETAMILYTILLDRARLSLKSDKWTDESGHTFLYYPVKSLAGTLHKSENDHKNLSRRTGKGRFNKTGKAGRGSAKPYLCKNTSGEGKKTVCRRDRILSHRGTGNCLPEGQKTVHY